MNRKVLRIIIFLTTISLLAAMITQLLWVRDAWSLKEDQFNSKVEIALKSVVNQLMTNPEYGPADPELFEEGVFLEHEALLTVVDPAVLDSLMIVEFNALRIYEDYGYGVYRQDDEQFVTGNFSEFMPQIVDSPHWVSLTCLCQEEIYLLSVYFPKQQSMILNSMLVLPVMSGVFLLVLVFSFFFTIYSLLRQKKLSDIKTDFVNNMTHEFKTPISTISVSSEMLMKDPIIRNPEKIRKYAKVIFDENARLKNQVEGVLQIAIIEKGEFKLKLKEMNAHELILECIDNFKIQVQERNGLISSALVATNPKVTVDRVHFSNIVNNLLDNANKYSPERPEISVSTKNLNGSIQIDVVDKGIGISREYQQDVFKKFHRLQTGDIHNVKGFGLGLFYVKTMVEEMGGSIELKSELEKGSCFSIKFPT